MKRAALAALALAGCDWSLHRMQEQPKCTTYASTDQLAGGACNLTPPEGAIALGAATPPARPAITRALIDRGRDRFDKMCAPCHGVAGDGDSDVARAMTVRRPPSLVDEAVQKFPDDRLEFVIEHGYGAMPSYASALVPDDRWAIVTYLRVLQTRDLAAGELPEEARAWLH